MDKNRRFGSKENDEEENIGPDKRSEPTMN
jgi:hypothetical protein